MTIYLVNASRVLRLLGVSLSVPLLLAGCGVKPSAQYIGTSTSNVHAKIPVDWQLFDGNEFIKIQTGQDNVALNPGGYLVPFGAPGSTVKDVLTASAVPTGVIEYRVFPEGTKVDKNAMLNPVVANLSQMVTDKSVDLKVLPQFPQTLISQSTEFSVPAGAGPEHFLQRVTLTADGKAMRILAIGCNPECFEKNRPIIEGIATSWSP